MEHSHYIMGLYSVCDIYFSHDIMRSGVEKALKKKILLTRVNQLYRHYVNFNHEIAKIKFKED